MNDDALQLRVLRSVDECEPWRQQMNALNMRSFRPCPFSTVEYLRSYVEYDEFTEPGELAPLVLLATENNCLRGYLPLRCTQESFLGSAHPKITTLTTHDCDRPHVVAEAPDLERCHALFYRHVFSAERWDFLELVDQDEANGAFPLPASLALGRHYVRRQPAVANATIPIAYNNLGSYYRAIRRKVRLNLARVVRRLMTAGSVEWLWASSANDVQLLLEDYMRIEQRSWKHAVRGTICRDPRRVAFFRTLAAEEQPMRLCVGLVVLDGLPVAGMVVGLFGDGLFGLQMCFDEQYAALAPGQLLLLLVVRQAIMLRCRFINLLHGSFHYKERWLAEVTPTWNVQVFRRNSALYAKARAGNIKHAARMLLAAPAPVACNLDKRRLELRVVDDDPLRCESRALFARLGDTLESGEHLRGAELARELPFALAGAAHRFVPTSSGPPRLRSTAVAVFDADAPPALAFTRSLGKSGVPVKVYSPLSVSVCGSSRFSVSQERCPPANDAASFIPWLAQRLRRGEVGLVAPTSDQMAFYLAELEELLPAELRSVLPPQQTVLDLLFKDRFFRRCQELHVPTPRCMFPSSIEEAADLAAVLSYPVILKPKSHVAVGGERGVVVESAEEMRRLYRPYTIPASWTTVVARYPELRLPMVQEYIALALDNLYSVSGLLGPGGELIACAVSHKTAQWPPLLGVGTIFEGCDHTRCLQEGVRAAQMLVGRGLFELELIYDPSRDEFLAIDLNPRAYGQIGLDIARGNDLPLGWYRMAKGELLHPSMQTTTKLRWIHSIPFHLGHWIGLLLGPERRELWRAYVASFGGETVDIVNERGDPLPSLVFTAKMLRHPGGLVRPFLNKEGARGVKT